MRAESMKLFGGGQMREACQIAARGRRIPRCSAPTPSAAAVISGGSKRRMRSIQSCAAVFTPRR